MTTHPTRVFAASVAYFAIVFAAGFVLGAVRTLLLTPRLGQLPAVLLELPVILSLAWFVCGRVVKRFQVPRRVPARAAMGAIAFSLLMLAEGTLAVALFSSSARAFIEELTTPHGLVGLAGQLLFGLMPLMRRAP